MFTAQVLPTAKFLSTLSLRRATKACRTWTYERLISIHALLAESDGASSKYMSYGWDFYPRSPCGERRSAADLPRPVQDFYPRSPCGERQVLRYGVLTASLISIHALLAESDDTSKDTIKTVVNFYPRSPCGERRYLINTYHRIFGISIHALLAESDSALGGTTMPEVYFYPRSPCGERHLRVVDGSKSSIISIHALLAESDYDGLIASANFCRFLSTLSLRRATVGTNNHVRVSQNFYPRSPCGERQARSERINRDIAFLSTLSLRRATSMGRHAQSFRGHFYPRSPCGERRHLSKFNTSQRVFLSTLSLRRATSDTARHI